MRAALVVIWLSGCSDVPPDILARLAPLSPPTMTPVPDVTNRFADDPQAALFGQRLFFDPGFSGPLLDDENTGIPGTLGLKGEAGKVSCASCHVPESGFLDSRSAGGKLSLASSWTRRRTPSLLNFGQATFLTWDGRRDTAFSQPFGVIESPIEFNSSRLFVAQQIVARHADSYQSLFGTLPPLNFAAVDPTQAGCSTLPTDPLTGRCPQPGHDDDAVIGIVANVGKALEAYQRLLTCGESRFDAWMHGDAQALDAKERAGAAVFIRSGCDKCHSGPNLSDQKFHNVGAANLFPAFIAPFDDPGAAVGLAEVRTDRLNSRGPFSDGDDQRLDTIPADTEALRGAFRTPSLRCVGLRTSYMHGAEIRTLADVILFFNKGGDSYGFQGVKDPLMTPLGLSDDERAQLLAFLRTLDGPGPDISLRSSR